jgi:transposase InsO family protein
MISKDQVLEKFRIFKAMVEKATRRFIRTLRTDRGGEYLSQDFTKFCQEVGISR